MKKNKWILWILPVLAISHFGFEWGAQPGEKKSGSSAMGNSQSRGSGLPFPQMMGALSQNMTLWPTLSEENKKKAVEATVMLFRERQNTAIMRPADFYVTQIDRALAANSQMQGADLMTVVKMMAVMEYDFYNGQNKDALAKEVLGEKVYEGLRSKRQ